MMMWMRAERQRLLRFALIALLLSSCLMLPRSSAYADDSTPKPTSEGLSQAEAAQAFDLISQQDETIALLRLDLAAARSHASIDSTLHARELELLTRSYEEMLAAYKSSRPGFLERLVKQPIIWLALGTYFGSQATR